MSATVAIKNNKGQCDRATPRTFLKTNGDSGTPVRLTAASVSAIAHTAGARTATVTTSAAHWLKAGDEVDISGANESAFNGTFRILTVPSTTTYTINVPEGAPASATGTITQVGHVLFRDATFYGKKAARTANTGTVWLGPESANGDQHVELPTPGELSWPVATGVVLDLADLYLDVATNDDGVLVSFH